MEHPPSPASDDLPWDELFDRADQTIQQIIAGLPLPIRERARKVATLLEKWPPDEADGDLLGQFHGFEDAHIAESLGPIFIYVGPIHEMCQEENAPFETEVRRTYLHELGHFFGLDEAELDERGLS